MKKINTITLWGIFCVLLIATDILIKNYISNTYALGESTYITNFLNITKIYNYGAAFSLLSSSSGWQNYLFIFFAIAIVFVTVKYFWHNYSNNLLSLFFAFIVSGAIGNMLDRIFFNHVTDYIHFHFYNYSFPIFNFADILIFIGVIGLVIHELKKK